MDACVKKYITDDVALYCGDTCDLIRDFGDESMHFIIFSPPFSSLYVYSNGCSSILRVILEARTPIIPASAGSC